ncbi:hypothetical protein D9758_016524 [Tetrapyrgos nigripes]|uniref:Helitron helicase-like domain-containing protein n=1 Tax=Tetrapyrgos nigripes TaxID=182062 RepID=A0A8H5CLL0_9AGAR|nr:hypothetical protein D9758_016524 [Tetrapyrgos nigripes]
MPKNALAQGLWIGDIPNELKDLGFAEKLLIARVRHSRCLVKVASGRYKMKANIMCFSNPVDKIYDILPLGKDELDKMIAFMFTGPSKPTPEQLRDTPLLVRQAVVKRALEWLKLNHKDYQDIAISDANLNSYDEEAVLFSYEYQEQQHNKDALTTAINEEIDDEGTESGPCPVTVHGLTGEEFGAMTSREMRAAALKHLRENKKNILYVAHNEQPVSTFHNPSLFPMMYPHLFPYGLGGINNSLQTSKIGQTVHKAFYLMYHDKRFQLEPSFSIIAFNVEQMKQSNDGGFIITHRKNINSIAERIWNIDSNVLDLMYNRFKNKERVVPSNEQEKACLQLINDVDATASRVQGSVTSKKHMRNEVWSLINKIGSPSWFITISPADVNHPICLYFADTDQEFKPYIQDKKTRERLIKQNPVAAARFFDFMFTPFYWTQYVDRVRTHWKEHDNILHAQSESINIDQSIPDEKVWVNKGNDNSFIGVSKIDDYSLRGEEIENINLYNFMSAYYKKSVRKKKPVENTDYDDETNCEERDMEMDVDKKDTRIDEYDTKFKAPSSFPSTAMFSEEHSQHLTHALFKYKNLDSRALNFAGQTWEEAFRDHMFTDTQKQLMRNFNLRYECNDARDDYSALRKRGHSTNGPAFDLDELDDEAMHEFLQNVNNTFEDNICDSVLDFNTEELLPNNSTIRNHVLNDQISKTLDNSGMMDPHVDKYNIDQDTNVFQPDITIEGSKWKQKIAEEKN